ncbi:MAG: FeoB-associated Cys-rich membrane protein [Clostridiales bacterium]|nr:FeoB-associated Cys-rich membrane protein [Clostridiales bacterium]
MTEWIMDNLGTIIVSAILIVIVGLAVGSLIRKKIKGESTCGCGCSNCPASSTCHKKV